MIRFMSMMSLLIRLILSIRLREIVISGPGDLNQRCIEIVFGSMRLRVTESLGIEIEDIQGISIKAPLIFLETDGMSHWGDVLKYKIDPDMWDKSIEDKVLEEEDEALCKSS
jgi:hypothetical protein